MGSKYFLFILSLIFCLNLVSAIFEINFVVDKSNDYSVKVYSFVSNDIRSASDIRQTTYGEDEIEAIMLDDKNNNVYSKTQKISFWILSDPPVETNRSLVFLELPYKKNMTHVQIKHDGKIIADIKKSDYIKPETLTTPTSEENSTKCFVATAVYGDENAPEVETLREIRDAVLKKSDLGNAFVDFYYSGAGRETANFVRTESPILIPFIKEKLDRIVEIYNLI